MTNRVLGIITSLLILLSLLFVARSALSGGETAGRDDLAGPLLVWHSWMDERAEALSQAKTKFEEMYPGVQVLLVGYPQEELYAHYVAATANGFGPDLLIAPSEWLPGLLAGGLVSAVEPEIVGETSNWFEEEIKRTVRSQDQIYAIPFSLSTWVFYYNKAAITRPATTLDELLVEAGEGAGVGIGSSFASALWGIGASGGRLYDDKGEVVIDIDGLTNWLTWLRNAQNKTSFVMSTNQEGLRQLFVRGELEYLVDESTGLSSLSAAMPSNALGVRPLPSGPGGSATPLLRTEALFFSPVSSARQHKAASILALFLAGKEQQTLLMRRAGLVPAHREVRVNSRLNPEIYAFVTQSRMALPWTNNPLLVWLLKAGDETYVQVLEGVLSPAEAAAELSKKLDEQAQ